MNYAIILFPIVLLIILFITLYNFHFVNIIDHFDGKVFDADDQFGLKKEKKGIIKKIKDKNRKITNTPTPDKELIKHAKESRLAYKRKLSNLSDTETYYKKKLQE